MKGEIGMGWREFFSGASTPTSLSGTGISWADPNAEAVRAATAEAAGRPIDVGYITDDLLASRYEAEYWVDEGEKFKGPGADAIIESYGGEPIGRFSVAYGCRAACLEQNWLFYGTRYQGRVWHRTGLLLKGPGPTRIVGECADGSPVWEFRI